MRIRTGTQFLEDVNATTPEIDLDGEKIAGQFANHRKLIGERVPNA